MEIPPITYGSLRRALIYEAVDAWEIVEPSSRIEVIRILGELPSSHIPLFRTNIEHRVEFLHQVVELLEKHSRVRIERNIRFNILKLLDIFRVQFGCLQSTTVVKRIMENPSFNDYLPNQTIASIFDEVFEGILVLADAEIQIGRLRDPGVDFLKQRSRQKAENRQLQLF